MPPSPEDIRLLCDQGLLDEERLIERLESAFLWHTDKDGNPDRDNAFANLDIVRRYLRGEVREL